MANNLEIREKQTERLFDLLELKAINSGIKVNGLDKLIERAKAPMDKEDIASVEKSIAMLYS
ncbi:MAG: hypothetical protein FWB98_05875 [Defluviitaleaceae bacterium]|nr:hypothetical protein [Defluviitaleaceae bacterium]